MEKSIKGINVTDKSKSLTDKINKEYQKDFNKKFKEYSKVDEVEGVEHNKYTPNKKQEEYKKDFGQGEGIQDLKFDSEPSDRFKDRAKKAIVGDSSMGNKDDISTPNSDFGKNLIDKTKRKNKKIDDNKLDYIILGNDLELTGNKVKGKPIAFENKVNTKLNVNKEIKDLNILSKLIPEKYKINENRIKLNDSVKSIDLTWNGNSENGYVTINEVININKNSEIMNEILKRINYGKK